jgi:predicted N-acetyltransferase YhbS
MSKKLETVLLFCDTMVFEQGGGPMSQSDHSSDLQAQPKPGIQIRVEQPKDRQAVEAITRSAFWNTEQLKRDGIGCTEHYLVHALRDTIAVPELNLVAERDGDIVGHVMMSIGSHVVDEDQTYDVLTLAPLTVKPSVQNQGIGTALMHAVLAKAADLGFQAVILYGDPDYYHRFGFVDAKTYHITTEDGTNFPAFMALELQEGSLRDVQGRYMLHATFDEKSYLPLAIEYDQNQTWTSLDTADTQNHETT